jgi:ABC-type uncharacterized transport system substrate-binding protein
MNMRLADSLARACALALALSPGAAFAAPTPTAAHPHYFTRAVNTVTLTPEQQHSVAAFTARYRAAHPDSAPHDQKAEDAFHQQILSVLTPAQRTRVQDALVKLRAAGTK